MYSPSQKPLSSCSFKETSGTFEKVLKDDHTDFLLKRTSDPHQSTTIN